KPDVDDLRESPAAEVIRLLQDQGASVRAFEPFRPQGLPGIVCTPTLESALEGAEVIVLLTGHTQFVRLDPASLLELTSARTAIDTVGQWNAAAWEAAGFRLVRLGVNRVSPIAPQGR
ncbi:MAG: UDP binding domain-containing protein, partial [Bacteroidota bacterium]